MTPPRRRPLVDQVAELCSWAEETLPPETADHVSAVRRRVTGPLRVAIAGRVKAGKSTLLNAILGELVAPTDAGECTRIVTWYRHGLGYSAIAHLADGSTRTLDYNRGGGSLTVDLGELAPDDVVRLDVSLPIGRLEQMTLIDTPGLEGLNVQASERAREFLGLTDEGSSDVDAVVYLVRHFHRRDAEFLEAFHDRTIARPSPVNAIAVLSRADEIGAARLDALESAAAIAARYAGDPVVRQLCATVIPVAGLIAESGRTLQEREWADLRKVATGDPDELASMLLSVDRFCDERSSVLDSDRRRALLTRFGLFGIRFAIEGIRSGRLDTSVAAADAMVAVSGIGRLFDLLDRHFGRRARALKARAALANLRVIARDSARPGAPDVLELENRVETIEASAHELDELRLLHLMLSRSVEFEPELVAEIEALLTSAAPAARLGFDHDAEPDALVATILRRIDWWRRRAESALTQGAAREACTIVVHSYEALYSEVAATVE